MPHEARPRAPLTGAAQSAPGGPRSAGIATSRSGERPRL